MFHDTWRRSGNQYPTPLWLISNWIDTETFKPPSPEQRRNPVALGLTEDDGVVAFIGRHWIKGSRIVSAP